MPRLGMDRGTLSGLLWHIIWYIAPRTAEAIGSVLEKPCQATFGSGRGLNKHRVRGVIGVRIFFNRRRLQELASER